MGTDQTLVRAILAPLASGSILLPSNVVAEVADFSKPVPYEHGPTWLLGEVEWNSWQVPIISFASLTGSRQRDTVSSASRILIVKTLTEEVSLYYIGILIKGLPKLKKIEAGTLQASDEASDSAVVHCHVTLDGETAIIPELEALVRCVADAIYDQ